MSDPELPPLPEIDWLSQFVPIYAREHMRDYGRTCYALAQGEIERKAARIDYLERTHVEPEAWRAFEDGLKFSKERAKAAEQERDELRAQLEYAEKQAGECHAGYEILVKELEAAQKDAERYRWIRSFENGSHVVWRQMCQLDFCDEVMDKAIDLARTEKTEGA